MENKLEKPVTQNQKETKDVTGADSPVVKDVKSADEKNGKNGKNGKDKGGDKKSNQPKKDYSALVTEGMNLIPPKAKEEIALEEKKGKFNIGAALSILGLVVISIGIVAYNIIQKNQLNNLLDQKTVLEKQVKAYDDLLYKNAKLNRRIQLFSYNQNQSVSYKEVFDYWQKVSTNLGTINEIELGDDMTFMVSGEADSLTDVAKLWHFLSIDERVVNVNLEGFGKSDTGATFSFTGTLDLEYFLENN